MPPWQSAEVKGVKQGGEGGGGAPTNGHFFAQRRVPRLVAHVHRQRLAPACRQDSPVRREHRPEIAALAAAATTSAANFVAVVDDPKGDVAAGAPRGQRAARHGESRGRRGA